MMLKPIWIILLALLAIKLKTQSLRFTHWTKKFWTPFGFLPKTYLRSKKTHNTFPLFESALWPSKTTDNEGEYLFAFVNTNALGPGAYPFSCPPRGGSRAWRRARLQRRRFRSSQKVEYLIWRFWPGITRDSFGGQVNRKVLGFIKPPAGFFTMNVQSSGKNCTLCRANCGIHTTY